MALLAVNDTPAPTLGAVSKDQPQGDVDEVDSTAGQREESSIQPRIAETVVVLAGSPSRADVATMTPVDKQCQATSRWLGVHMRRAGCPSQASVSFACVRA